jgi:hypothetical protein
LISVLWRLANIAKMVAADWLALALIALTRDHGKVRTRAAHVDANVEESPR